MIKVHRITHIEDADIKLTQEMLCGGSKKDRDTIVYLYKKYIDTSTNICKSCNSELVMLMKKYIYYYDIYMKENTQKDGK